MNVKRATWIAWLLGPLLAFSVAATYLLAARHFVLIASFAGIWCFLVLQAIAILYFTAQGEYNRQLPQRCPEVLEQYTVADPPPSALTIRRTFGSAHDSRIARDPELIGLAWLVLACGVAPFWFVIGLLAGALLAPVM